MGVATGTMQILVRRCRGVARYHECGNCRSTCFRQTKANEEGWHVVFQCIVRTCWCYCVGVVAHVTPYALTAPTAAAHQAGLPSTAITAVAVLAIPVRIPNLILPSPSSNATHLLFPLFAPPSRFSSLSAFSPPLVCSTGESPRAQVQRGPVPTAPVSIQRWRGSPTTVTAAREGRGAMRRATSATTTTKQSWRACVTSGGQRTRSRSHGRGSSRSGWRLWTSRQRGPRTTTRTATGCSGIDQKGGSRLFNSSLTSTGSLRTSRRSGGRRSPSTTTKLGRGAGGGDIGWSLCK